MAFSLRKMLSNISYFKKPGEDGTGDPSLVERLQSSQISAGESSNFISFEHIEPDSTSKQAASLKLPESIKKFAPQKGSLSDTDLTINIDNRKLQKRRSKKLKLDIKKANKSMDENINREDVENTPKHMLLEGKSSDIFSERIKKFDLSKSFDIFDAMSDEESSPYEEENMDIESLSDSDTEISIASNHDEKVGVKMCRKVGETDSQSDKEGQLVPSASLESFGDVEVYKNEEERVALLLNYQMKLERMDCFLKKLLGEFRFHIDVSRIFHCRSFVTALPGNNIPKILGEVAYTDNLDRGVSPSGWNVVIEKEDNVMKFKLKKQLLSMKHSIDQFVKTNLKNVAECDEKLQTMPMRNRRSFTPELLKVKRPKKRLRVNTKKKLKHFDYPDFRESMINLFNIEAESEDSSVSGNNSTNPMSDFDELDILKCHCRCHVQSPSSQTDSGVTTKSNERSMSITSSLGNFSLDSTTLTAYSESLDIIVSYNSFQDTSLYSTLLQKAAIERITFYVQVHSIQLNCEVSEQDYESKNVITFYCPSCKTTENEENGLLRHILSQSHCAKIHFQYKTAYIKKCVQSGKEIMPSTVLNPMKMYRDDNKIVCFGDAIYACSLCFENLIVGESVLMTHCLEPEHVERRAKLAEILE